MDGYVTQKCKTFQIFRQDDLDSVLLEHPIQNFNITVDLSSGTYSQIKREQLILL